MSKKCLCYSKECFPALLLKELQDDSTVGLKILSVKQVVDKVQIVGDGLTNDDKKIVDGIVEAHKKTADFPTETVPTEDRG